MFPRNLLKEEIIRKCGKIMVFSEMEEEAEEEDNLKEESVENESITEEELSFEDILAEKRRKYGAKDEFIYFLYNDLLQYFVAEWDGHYLLKKFIPSEMHEKTSESIQSEKEGEEEFSDTIRKDSFVKTNNVVKDKTNILYSKLTLKDEHVHFSFVNGNSYFGRISRKMMEGEGLYKWHHGVQYKGQFEQNQMHGAGMLEWQNNCWYEGNFVKGYRHGKGTLMDRDYCRLYIGEWHMGYRHGKGYCRYAKNDSYDGEWSMGKKDSIGCYIYPSGAQYKGHWKNDFRHGNGIMAWSNGDVYYGEWEYGDMHGYGKCIWHGYCNRNLSWPQDISYMGNWCNNMRHGRGLLKLNSIGGAKCFGHWRHNTNHGCGMIIGNNGVLIEGEPLYTEDVLTPLCAEKLSKILEPCIATILKPEQFPSISYHINRLMKLSLIKKCFAYPVSWGKCYVCNEQQSCSCLLQSSFQATDDRNIQKNDYNIKWEYEKNRINDFLILHMSQIWQVYNIYAKLFSKTESKCHLVMVRLTLWQLWRDCNITRKGLSLIEIDDYIVENESCFVRKSYDPFEKIEIWQFLHALIEVSWRLYYWRNDEIKKNGRWTHGILARCLHEFLTHDVYPNVGNFVGLVPREYHNLLPIYSVYKLYKQIEYPPTAINILIASVKDHTVDTNAPPMSPLTLILPEYILNGLNCVTFDGRINFLPREKPFMQNKVQTIKKLQRNGTNDLLLFQELGSSKIVEIMAKVCPLIKDNDTNVILNMNYSLTFLEFYEIILESARCIIESRKIKKAQNVSSTLNIELTQNSISQAQPTSIRFPSRSVSRQNLI